MGGELGPITVAYETWGELAADAANAVLVLHALTGDSHAAGPATKTKNRETLITTHTVTSFSAQMHTGKLFAAILMF